MIETGAVFYFASEKIANLAIVSIAMSALAFAEATGIVHARTDSISLLIGWAGGIFFALCAAILIQRYFVDGPIVEVNGNGFRDVRLSSDIIGWDAIEAITLVNVGWQSSVRLKLVSASENKFSFSLLCQASSVLNFIFGWGGIYTSMAGMNGTTNELLEAIDKFAPERLKRR